eukprot:PhF_6_TR12281/c0_g1_i1/m.19483
MDFLYHGRPYTYVLRAVTCLVIHENVVVPMDVVHTTFDLYSWVWKFASHWQCDPAMPDLSFDGEYYYKGEDPEMLIDPTGNTSWHIAEHEANSIALMTPSFTMEEVAAGYIRPCRLRFPQDGSGCLHFIFVYREGCQVTTSLRYDPFTEEDELVIDVHVTCEGLAFYFVNDKSTHQDQLSSSYPTQVLWKDIEEDKGTEEMKVKFRQCRLWLGVYTYMYTGSVTIEEGT